MGACEVVGRIGKLLKELLLNLREGKASHDSVFDQIIHQFCVRSVLSSRLVIVLARMLMLCAGSFNNYRKLVANGFAVLDTNFCGTGKSTRLFGV